MSEEIEIRGIRKDDFLMIIPLIEELMDGLEESVNVLQEIWNKNFECDHYVGFVAVINSKIVGYVDIIFFQDIAHGGFLGQIQNLIVAKEYRGQGIGKRLVKKAIDFAKEMGFKELHVWTKFDNVKAISLYEKMGFKRSSLLLEIEF